MTLSASLTAFSRRIGRFEFPIEQTRAFAEAGRNFEANKAALESVWPRTILAIPDSLPELEWLYSRDGSLSGRHVDGEWIGQVSVPAKAAAKMLDKAVVTGSSAVLLAPTHAQQIRVVLDRMSAQQVLIVVIPGEYAAGMILACADFSTEIRAQRLWLACGPEWSEELNAILATKDGIAPASMMIRVPGLNAEVVERIIKPCEVILAKNSQSHRTHLQLLHTKPRSPSRPIRKLCVVTGTFKLWDDAPHLLSQAIARSSVQAVVLDSSIPTQCSALKVARSADGCDAILTANVARTDLPMVVPENVPWITWLTTNRMPRCDVNAVLDRMILAERSQVRPAMEAGWPESRIILGQEGIRTESASRAAIPAIIADLPRISMPKSVEDMSSQRLVWEQIEHDVGGNALCVGPSPIEFIYTVAEKIGLARTALPIDLFRTELLIPVFMRSLARQMYERGIKFAIYGRGWDTIPELADQVRGPVESEQTFTAALTATSIILDVWPGEPTHPARRAGRPVLRPWGRDFPALVREINRASMATMKSFDTPVLNLQGVLDSI